MNRRDEPIRVEIYGAPSSGEVSCTEQAGEMPALLDPKSAAKIPLAFFGGLAYTARVRLSEAAEDMCQVSRNSQAVPAAA